MIPLAQITQWRSSAPWPDDIQVEQDLILSRILVAIFSDPFLYKELAFRGGTALHKLFFSPAVRYSEDIDLVRTGKGPISNIADNLRNHLEPWLGKPKIDPTSRSFKMKFSFNPEGIPSAKQRIKIEINIEECFSILPRSSRELTINSGWFSGRTTINTFHFNELIATKLRALYQRSKGRDLFDLWLALDHKDFNAQETVHVFSEYMKKSGKTVTKNMFDQNINLKLKEHSFLDDIGPLLSPHYSKNHSRALKTQNDNDLVTETGEKLVTEGWNLVNACEEIKNKILAHFPK